MKMIKKILYIFDKRQKINLIILFGVIFIGGFVELLSVSAILPLINVIMDPNTIVTNEKYYFIYKLLNMKSDRQFVVTMALALIIIFILKNIYVLEMYNLQYRFTHNNQRRTASRLMTCYMRQDYLYHVERNSANLQRNMTGDVSNFYSTVLYLLQLATEIIVCTMLVLYLMYEDFITTVGVVALIGVFSLLFFAIYRPKMIKGGERYRKLGALIFKWIQQSLGGIKEIKILNKEDFFLHKFDTIYEKSMRTMRKQRMINLIPRSVMETLCIGGLLSVVAIQILLGADMTSFVSTLSVFALAAFRMLPSFNRITTELSNIMFSKASVDCIYNEIIETEKNIRDLKIECSSDSVEKLTYDEGIHISNLKFRYPNTDHDVLNGITLDIAKNTSVAFIGSSGSGKTTLIDTLLGVLRPSSGTIMCDDRDIWSNINGWHENIGYIPQTIYLMDDTIRNNIAFGIDTSDIDENNLWKALEESQLAEFVRSLPEGLETIVGEKGVKLSGGQRQRIGIARALYNDPEVLVMDEATSALDNETEKGVMDAIDALSGKKTIIIVAHRLTTIINCDYIYEMKKGIAKIVSREEVMNRILEGNEEKDA